MGIHRATIAITLVSTIVGAVITFSNLLDANMVTKLIDKIGQPEYLKWILATLSSLGVGAWVGRALYRKEMK